MRDSNYDDYRSPLKVAHFSETDQGYRKVQNEKASENEPVGSSAMHLPPSKYKPAKTRLIKSKKGSNGRGTQILER